MRFPGGKSKAFTLSYDDGFEPDIRLMKILKKYHLKGTFNLNSGMFGQDYTVYYLNRTYRRLDREQVTRLYAYSGMEVAVHGLTHAGLTEIPVSGWYQLFGDSTYADACLSRMTSKAYRLEFPGRDRRITNSN